MGLFPAIIAHEMGHAVVGWLVGLPPRVISLGIGPPLYVARWASLAIVVRPIPLGGHVQVQFGGATQRLRFILLFAGGAAGNLAAVAVLVAVSIAHPVWSDPCGKLAALQFFIVFLALLPVRWKLDGRRIASDGLQILGYACKGVRYDYARYRAMLKAVDPDARHPAAPSADGFDIIAQVGRFSRTTEAWERQHSIEILRDILLSGRATAAERLYLLERLISWELTARCGYISEDELDSWSIEAMAVPYGAGCTVTRGGVLAMLGRPVEAKIMLLSVIDQDLTPINRAGANAFLAQASASLGDDDSVEHFAEAARRIASCGEAGVRMDIVERLLAHVGQA